MHKFSVLSTKTFCQHIETPIGKLKIIADESYILSISFDDDGNETKDICNVLTQKAAEQITGYFVDNLSIFNLPLAFSGTLFQQLVWKQVYKIPFAETISYLDVAKGIKNEKAVRAVASAIKHNPLLLVIPCHRVVGSNSQLIGYSGRLWPKKWLLEHEQKNANASRILHGKKS